MECLHLVFLGAGETRNTSTASILQWLIETECETHNTITATTVTHWKWNKQRFLSGISVLSIIECWRDVYVENRTKSAYYIAINCVECLHIAACWRDTQYKHCGIYCDPLKVEQMSEVSALSINCCVLEKSTASIVTHWKWNKQCLLLLLSGVSVLSIITVCWRDTQHKHYIYCPDHWRPRLMTSDDHLQVSFK